MISASFRWLQLYQTGDHCVCVCVRLRLRVVVPLAARVYFHVFILSCKSVRVFRGEGFAVLTYAHHPALTGAEKRISGRFKKKI